MENCWNNRWMQLNFQSNTESCNAKHTLKLTFWTAEEMPKLMRQLRASRGGKGNCFAKNNVNRAEETEIDETCQQLRELTRETCECIKDMQKSRPADDKVLWMEIGAKHHRDSIWRYGNGPRTVAPSSLLPYLSGQNSLR